MPIELLKETPSQTAGPYVHIGLALAAAALLVAYGGLLVLAGAGALLGLTGSAPAEPTALRWHVLFWDPWFLL